MLGILIGGFITILIGVNLLPTLASEVVGATSNTNVSSLTAVGTVTNLLPLFFAIGILCAGVGMVAQGMYSAGIM